MHLIAGKYGMFDFNDLKMACSSFLTAWLEAVDHHQTNASAADLNSSQVVFDMHDKHFR